MTEIPQPDYEHKIELNNNLYELNDEFRDSIEERAKREYSKNPHVSTWWKEDEAVLVIETVGTMVPWDDLDQLEAEMMEPEMFSLFAPSEDEWDEPEELDGGGGAASLPPEAGGTSDDGEDIFGRTHFGMTPHRYEEVPSPRSDDPDKIPPKPERLDDESLVVWIPRHPDMEHTWDAGEAITAVDSWVEWDVQRRANQPTREKPNTHDRFESLCRAFGCEKVGELKPSDNVPGNSGSVERKGEKSFEDGKFGGDNWNV